MRGKKNKEGGRKPEKPKSHEQPKVEKEKPKNEKEKPKVEKPTEGGENQFKFSFGGEGEQGAKFTTFDFGGKDSGLVPHMQKKLNSLIGKTSGYFETLPAPVQNRIKGLKSLHHQKAEIDKQYKKELAELEAKFSKLIDPIYERRKKIVTGVEEPTEEELKAAALREAEAEATKEEVSEEKKDEKTEQKEETKKEEKGEEKGEESKEQVEDVKGVPNFWLCAMQHHGDFAESITKQDEKAMKYLVDIRSKPLPLEEGRSDSSFLLEFEFNENPYFTNKILTKTYCLVEHEQLQETMFDKMEGTDIDWKPGKNLTVKMVQVQQNAGRRGGRKNRGKGGKSGGKTTTVEEPCESFFNFFKSDIAAAFGITDEDIEDADLQDLLEADYEMGVSVKEQLIPSAVLWFTGEIEEPFDEDDESGEEGEYDSAEDPDFEPDPNAPKPECAQQ